MDNEARNKWSNAKLVNHLDGIGNIYSDIINPEIVTTVI